MDFRITVTLAAFGVLGLFGSSCSLSVSFSQCESDSECGAGDRCVDEICVASGVGDVGLDADAGLDAGADTGTDDASFVDVADASEDDSGGGDDRPPGRTACADRPASNISEPKRTVGNGNASSCTFEALKAAIAGSGKITFDCGVAPHTITFTERVAIDNDVHLDGGGMITFDGAGATRLFLLDTTFQSQSPHLVLEGLTLRNGRATTGDSLCGGAVSRPGGTLTIIDSVFENNGCTPATEEDDPVGGAIAAIDGGPLTIFGSEFRGNEGAGGGAIFVRDTAVSITNTVVADNRATNLSGGGLTAFGQTALTICGSSFENNDARFFGGGVFYRDNEAPRARVEISQSTFSGNVATEDGGAADIGGADLLIDSSTFDSNVAEQGGGLWLGDDIIEMINVTFHANESTIEAGAAIYHSDSNGSIQHGTFARNIDSGGLGAALGSLPDAEPAITISSTIFWDDSQRDGVTMCSSTQLDGGGNVQWPDGSTACTDAVTFGDPLLSDITQNGGRTRTMLPSDDSAAAGAGVDCPRFDQRGVIRPTSGCTSGATQIE